MKIKLERLISTKKVSYILFHIKYGMRKIAPQKTTPQKISPQKIAHEKIAPQKYGPYENPPQWMFPTIKAPPVKITPQKFARNYENPSSPLINHTNKRKSKITKFFAFKKAVQHNILIKITKVLFDTQMISQKILGLDTFFTEWKKSKNQTKAKIAKWHLLASCKSQGELKLGSQIIKFGKYVKLLNSQLSLHIHLWI